MLEREGHAALSLAKVISFVGDGLPMLVRRVMAHTGMPDREYRRIHAYVLEEYNASASQNTVVYDGVFEVLEALRSGGFSLGICTNKPEEPARHVVDALGLAPFFPVLIGGDTTSKRKPDPYPLFQTITQLGATEVLYVGDSEVDAATAEAADVKFALYTEGYRKTPVAEIRHTWQFSRFDQFLKVVGLSTNAP